VFYLEVLKKRLEEEVNNQTRTKETIDTIFQKIKEHESKSQELDQNDDFKRTFYLITLYQKTQNKSSPVYIISGVIYYRPIFMDFMDFRLYLRHEGERSRKFIFYFRTEK